MKTKRNGDRPRKRRRRGRKAALTAERQVMVSLDFARGTVEEVGCHPVSEEAGQDAELYFFAHSLLPQDFVCGCAAPCAVVDEAIHTLEQRELVPTQELLRALVVLGHSPGATALAALTRVVADGGPWSGVAELARAECADWSAALGVPLPPVH